MAGRPIFAAISLILVAGAGLLVFLVLLAGAINGFPLNTIYFLQAETQGIPEARDITRWTLWNTCGDSNGYNANCDPISAAHPFDPQSNFVSQNHVPAGFIGQNQFYYQSRVVFAFTLISLFCIISSLFLGLFSLCFRIGAFLSSIASLVALLMQTVVAALMTSCFVMGKNIFQQNGMAASVGNEAFGFNWAAWACLFLASVLFCVAGSTSRGSDSHHRRAGFLGRKKSHRDRGSFGHDAETSSFVRS